MQVRHTKFSCDQHFGNLKSKIRKSGDIYTMDEVEQIINNNYYGENEVILFRDFNTGNQKFKIFDFKTFFQNYNFSLSGFNSMIKIIA